MLFHMWALLWLSVHSSTALSFPALTLTRQLSAPLPSRWYQAPEYWSSAVVDWDGSTEMDEHLQLLSLIFGWIVHWSFVYNNPAAREESKYLNLNLILQKHIKSQCLKVSAAYKITIVSHPMLSILECGHFSCRNNIEKTYSY